MQHKGMLFRLAVAALILAAVSDSALAQGRGQGQGPNQAQGQGQGQRQGQAQRQGQGPGRAGTAGPQSQRAQDQRSITARNEIRDRLRNRDIYGRELMTAEERRQYRDRVNSAASDRQWAEIREQHMNEIRRRAESEGRPLDPPVYGHYMLTREERNEYQKRLESAVSEAERQRIRNEHEAMIRERSTQLGIAAPPGS